MKKPALRLLALLSLASCSSAPRPGGTATITLFGPETRLETWKTSVVEGIHVHAARPDEPCPAASIAEIANSASALLAEQKPELKEPAREMGKAMGPMMEVLFAGSNGPAHGGADRTVVALRHLAADGSSVDESVVIDLPRLKAGELERLFKAAEFKAFLERPPLTPEARLERGWVRATRLASGLMEFDLFLVLKPVRPGASYESIQVITRVGPPAR